MARPKTADYTIAELQELLEQKIAKERTKLPALETKREKLTAELEALNNLIALISGTPPSESSTSAQPSLKKTGSKRGRKPGTKNAAKRQTRSVGGKLSLPAAIHKVLEDAGEPMTTEAIRAAIKDQKLIKKISPSFDQQVRIALSRLDEFKRVGRGLYSL